MEGSGESAQTCLVHVWVNMQFYTQEMYLLIGAALANAFFKTASKHSVIINKVYMRI